ncbi:hypothetical protein NN3_11120 [Nocardia neocaledoniensis NBRC 108232]|uniref:Uncharacterized protein n=1 Tax=Nocardia neocaledoniensis TaxID=236511 RepID=A0A317NVU4_9NOCA|nr:hypothetical protein [Nocardia neocaledoniensis]PWV79516.1 hypothetical protein DFR69_102579 [Nocardia neocaledoniensis]GEM30105.1 hypothetical protein NN3_11120 [Nocardia neocaledoniensis NBRC 108232]
MVTDSDQPAPTAVLRMRVPSRLEPVITALIVTLLFVDALITLAVEVLFLPLYVGAVALPVAALLAAPINVALVYGMESVTDRVGFTFAPIVVWVFGFLVCSSRGPGGDVMLASDGRTLLLLACGVLAPMAYLYYRANSGAARSS